jgi:steroid 5-alpha reductase family enzyme
MTSYLLGALWISLLINLCLFLVAFRFKTDRLTDISYALTFVLLSSYGLFSCHPTTYHLVLFALVCLWAARLGGFLLYRVWKKKKDKRFDEMRNSFWKFGRFWLGQGLTVWVVLLPALMALHWHNAMLGKFSWLEIGLWLGGLAIEAVADWQKYKFSTQNSNKGTWIQEGLWKYSRHPNYLGEIMVWVGIYLFTFNALSVKGRLVGLISPLFIIAILLCVTGIPILEKSADARWGKDKKYQDYKHRTSILFILPRKK